jgi:hypothetical protein
MPEKFHIVSEWEVQLLVSVDHDMFLHFEKPELEAKQTWDPSSYWNYQHTD